MATLTIEIELENSAFENAREFDNVLDNIKEKINFGITAGCAVDSNGNIVGKFSIDEKTYTSY